jgi:alkaline phosphatase D
MDWIIVTIHDWVYRSSSTNPYNDDLSEVYHPLFDKYDVDLVLSGHDHRYHRSYPLKFNLDNPISPIVTNNNTDNYINPQGQVYAVVGTGGSNPASPTVGSSPFIASQHEDIFGQLDIRFINNGGKLEGRFYKNGNNVILDSFSITKSVLR